MKRYCFHCYTRYFSKTLWVEIAFVKKLMSSLENDKHGRTCNTEKVF